MYWKRLFVGVLLLACFVILHMGYLVKDHLPTLLRLRRGAPEAAPSARWRPAAAPASAIVPLAGAGAAPIDFVFNPSRLNLPAEADQSDSTVTMAGVCNKKGMMNWPVCKDWVVRWRQRFPLRPVSVGPEQEAVFLEWPPKGSSAAGGSLAAQLTSAASTDGSHIAQAAFADSLKAQEEAAGQAEQARQAELEVLRKLAQREAPPPPPLPPPPPPLPPAGAAPEDEAPMAPGGEHAGERTGTDIFAAQPHAPLDGGHADLASHRGNEQCWLHFDLGFLEGWDAAARMLCTPTGGLWEGLEGEMGDKLGAPYSSALAPPQPASAGGSPFPSAGLAAALQQPPDAFPPGFLRCRVMSDSHLPGPTAPHTLCDGANVYLYPALLTPTACLASRPGYKCDGPPIWWAYAPGALGAACALADPQWNLEATFPRDHLLDMFSSWTPGLSAGAGAGQLAGQGRPVNAAGALVLLVSREREEHANAFHATTDFINAFISLALAGVIDARTGEGDMSGVQVLLLDEQSGPFEALWYGRILSPSHPVLRVSALQASRVHALRMPRAVFVPPGYTNMLLSHVASEGDCHAGTQLLQGFRGFVLRALGLAGRAAAAAAAAASGASTTPLRIALISRRPYTAAGIQHGFVGRQIDNEEALLAGLRAALALAALPRPVEVERVDLALLDAGAQVELIALRADVVVGMHGAALTYAALLPPWAAVVELWPKPADIWRCFEHLAAMAGLLYERWSNADARAFRLDEAGDYTTVDVAAVAELVVKAARHAAAWRG